MKYIRILRPTRVKILVASLVACLLVAGGALMLAAVESGQAVARAGENQALTATAAKVERNVDDDESADKTEANDETAVDETAPTQSDGETAAVRTTSNPTPAPQPQPAPATDRLSIPVAGVDAPIISVGQTAAGNVDTPRSLYQVGWWNGSAWFGQSGSFATFLVGHTPGVFAGLRGLSAGAGLTVALADGAVFNYRVVAVETWAVDDPNLMYQALSPRAAGGLNLMTCAGTYNASTGTYNQRTVVYTVPV
jgi:sortase (surface protein transpeptidase)